MLTAVLGPPPPGLSEEQRTKILEQMNRLLEAHEFRNSKRYPPLLRFIVEETLEGRGDLLKERLIGMHVFNRPADYDTASDPIVRVTIAEIRKRIAQYYHNEERKEEIRIELMPGRYAPEFRMRRESAEQDTAVQEAVQIEVISAFPESLPVVPVAAHASVKVRRWRVLLWAAGAVLAIGIVTVTLSRMMSSALDQFWEPVLAPKLAVLFCIPREVSPEDVTMLAAQHQQAGPVAQEHAQVDKAGGPVGLTFLDHEWVGENIVYSDMLATLKIANVLARHHRDFGVRLNVSTTLDDLRHGPVILIGGLDNQWTMRTLASLPYRFAGSDADRYWIQDNKDPANKKWALDLKQQYAAVTRDYALIARLHNEQTGEPEIIVAGIGMSGTAAAGEFVADEERMVELRRRIGPGFRDRDFEVVLSTDVVNGVAGAPKILAASIW